MPRLSSSCGPACTPPLSRLEIISPEPVPSGTSGPSPVPANHLRPHAIAPAPPIAGARSTIRDALPRGRGHRPPAISAQGLLSCILTTRREPAVEPYDTHIWMCESPPTQLQMRRCGLP